MKTQTFSKSKNTLKKNVNQKIKKEPGTPQKTGLKTNLYVKKDIFELRKTNFVLWLPVITDQTPVDVTTNAASSSSEIAADVLTLGEIQEKEHKLIDKIIESAVIFDKKKTATERKTSDSVEKEIFPRIYIAQVDYDYVDGSYSFRKIADKPLLQAENFRDLWLLDVSEINLQEKTVYYYWFKVRNTNPYENNNNILYCTDPFATVIDERIQAQHIPVIENNQNHYSPSSVFIFKDGKIATADPDGEIPDWENLSTDKMINQLPTNNSLVLGELPVIWSYPVKGEEINKPGFTADANFRQVEKMISFDTNETYLDELFSGVINFNGKKYLEYLGINAFECCPPANSSSTGGWRYGTSDYFSPDYTLSDRIKENVTSPKTSTDFIRLVKACHKKGIRFFYDAVMAFATNNPYRHINYLNFFIHHGTGDPEQGHRDGYGGDLVRYKKRALGYNPNRAVNKPTVYYPAREFMKAHLREWIKNKGVSGIRIDSVPNIDCYNFLEEIKNEMTQFFIDEMNGTSDKMLIVGEELSVPAALLGQNRLDGQWNEVFKQIMRKVILGQNWGYENFEWSVKKMIDCRLLDRNFTKGTQAINYFTSHDVGGDENIRMFNYLNNHGVIFTEKPIKLAFSCLMTAIGIPMFLIGEEFGDAQDLFSDGEKQNDGVSFERLKADKWRQDLFYHTERLIRFRTKSKALASDDIQFIHSDFDFGKRVMAWMRGKGEDIVITVANFSDWGSASGTDYIVNNWPLFNEARTPVNKKWIEVTQKRTVPDQWIGREGIFPWEAKVYALVDANFDLNQFD